MEGTATGIGLLLGVSIYENKSRAFFACADLFSKS